MILNFGEEKSLAQALGDKDKVNAVRCGKCNNFVAFDNGDIDWIYRTGMDAEWGYIKCPWCGKQMFIGERMGAYITRQYFTVVEGGDAEDKMLDFKNGQKKIVKG